MADEKRIFMAMPLPDKTKDTLVWIQEQLKMDIGAESVKWVEKKNLHQTMVFLGKKQEDKIPEIIDIMDEMKTYDPLTLCLYRLKFHPDLRRARIIWVTLGEEEEKLTRYYHRLRLPLQLADIEFDTRFTPHITIGRVRKVRGKKLFSEKTIDKIQDFLREREKTFVLDKAVLYESKLTQNGPHYKPLHEITLGEEK